MEWVEVKIKTAPEATEVLTGFLMANNITNVRIVDDKEVARFLLDHPLSWDYKEEEAPAEGAEIIFYVPDEKIAAKIEKGLHKLADDIPDIEFGPMTISCGQVNDDDWLHEWRKTYKPFTIGESIVVRPFWEKYAPAEGETVFTIDPGAVFGTGLHATTKLCIMTLEKMPLQKAEVLDIGCGSGILSIIAILLGASSATACDIDPSAARCAIENARLNNIAPSQFEALTCDIFALEEKEYDIVLANIVADVIIELAPVVKRFMKAGGVFIASGIIDERAEEVKEALKMCNLKIKEERQLDGWSCLSIL